MVANSDESLELEFWVVANSQMWVLKKKKNSSLRAVEFHSLCSHDCLLSSEKKNFLCSKKNINK